MKAHKAPVSTHTLFLKLLALLVFSAFFMGVWFFMILWSEEGKCK